MSEALDFPKITAEAVEPTEILLTIMGTTETLTADTPEDVAGLMVQRVTDVARRLGRPVRVHTISDAEERAIIVHEDGATEVESHAIIGNAAPWWRRPAVLATVGVLVMGGLGAGAYAAHKATQPEPAAQPAAEATTEAQAQTFEPEITDEVPPVLSADGNLVGASTEDALTVLSAQDGSTVGSIDLPSDSSDEDESAVTITPHGDAGFVLVSGRRFAVSDGHTVDDPASWPAGQDQIIVRRGESLFAPQGDATPAEVQRVGDSQEYQSPEDGASFLAINNDDQALWATSEDGGTVITADADGSTTDSRALSGPSEDASLKTWLGVAADGNILTLWDADDEMTLVSQSPTSDDISASGPVSWNDESKAVLSWTGDMLRIDDSYFVTDSLSEQTIEGLSEVHPAAHGFTATQEKQSVAVDSEGIHRAPEGATAIGTPSPDVILSVKDNKITTTPKEN